MLCSEIFLLAEAAEIDVCNTQAIVNPWPSDLAKMLAKDSVLRALAEPGRFVIWPAEEALHQPVQIALGMDNRARRYLVFGGARGNQFSTPVGRFQVWVSDSAHSAVKPVHMSSQMRAALGIRRV